jgi:hypothetical protein
VGEDVYGRSRGAAIVSFHGSVEPAFNEDELAQLRSHLEGEGWELDIKVYGPEAEWPRGEIRMVRDGYALSAVDFDNLSFIDARTPCLRLAE